MSKRFVFDDGHPYYPIGVDLAWRNGNEPPLPESLARIAAIGGNWSRIWMTHFNDRDGMNLDWNPANPPRRGELSLDVARRWDAVIEAAGTRGVYLQVVLQHHGQYSTRTNPNWPGNPWNKAAGGWLAEPGDFFADPEAIRLTKAKYRYLVARWGYSSHVLAWELFNEVEWTDPMRARRPEAVVAWHKEMAGFLKGQDPNQHLVTTSATGEPRALWSAMDFEQRHAYPVDILPAISAIEAEADRIGKPLFIGEFGPQDVYRKSLREECLRLGLWKSLMGPMPGAAQSWFWDDLGSEPIVRHLRAAASFLKESRMADRVDLKPIAFGIETEGRAPLTFSPVAEWRSATRTEFDVSPSGEIPGLAEMPRFLQGNAHREMFPRALFRADFPVPATFSVTIGDVAKAGGSIVLRLDGKALESREFPATPEDSRVSTTATIPVAAGRHAIEVSNPGADWVRIDRLSIAPYLPALSAIGKGSGSFAVAWVRRLDVPAPAAAPLTGVLAIPGLKPGAYRVCWRDPTTGIPLIADRTEPVTGPTLRISTPPIRAEAALFVSPR